VGSEFVLACDMRFAARESAIFGQFEPSFGVIPGAGGAQHLARLMGRGRALEVMLSACDHDRRFRSLPNPLSTADREVLMYY
jgi:enoyl-CoA hydratase/carnithine racemase